ncbi:tyrosine-type recombinase/integrase [Neiella marina]|uniref:Tyrosine-type recombinase/integrase n=1 Tax=Neiella holothuriorum TaxID=2870530 RepID=A0ABS7EE89_9GAMM|nr:integrase arm-type DNA-binding domain-containing protein [Neiella holothuriorum]MBW8190652.1 tyrosine-type recombinase/integrase [Neiella holothuriorum]
MAKPTTSLSDTQIKKAKPREREYNLADGGGLQLRVRPSGVKSWLFNYTKPLTNKRTNLSLGTYPEIGLAKARELRHEARTLLAHGIDPKDQRSEHLAEQQAKSTNTFKAHAQRWYELKKKNVLPKTAEKMHLRLTKHALPMLGKLPLTELKPGNVVQALDHLVVENKIDTLKRVCRYINEIMRLAVASGDLEFNCLSDVTLLFPAHKSNNHPTLKPDELPLLVKALSAANIQAGTRDLILWQLHTMTRPVEAASTLWADVDFEKSLWVIPKETMKMNRDHTVPLSPQALEVLARRKVAAGHREYVFPGHRNPKTHITSQTANVALKRMGFGGKLVAHGMRALASTTLNEKGFEPDLVETALAHLDKNDTRRAYNRAEYIERRREMMCWWSALIEKA